MSSDSNKSYNTDERRPINIISVNVPSNNCIYILFCASITRSWDIPTSRLFILFCLTFSGVSLPLLLIIHTCPHHSPAPTLQLVNPVEIYFLVFYGPLVRLSFLSSPWVNCFPAFLQWQFVCLSSPPCFRFYSLFLPDPRLILSPPWTDQPCRTPAF